MPTVSQSFFPLSQFCFLRVQTFLKNHLLARVYAPASQEFLLFCCHKCHRKSINYYISIYCAKHIHILTIKTYKGWKFGKKSHSQTQFLSEIWADILPQISLIFITSVTLVTAKNQHRCWKARAYTRVRTMSKFPPLYLLPFSRNFPKWTIIKPFWQLEISFNTHFKVFSSLLRDFFTLRGYISPYTYRGLDIKQRKAFWIWNYHHQPSGSKKIKAASTIVPAAM